MKKLFISLLPLIFISQLSLSQQSSSITVNYYFWGNATYNSIGGDFDGKGSYNIEELGDNTIILPDYGPSVGWEIGMGASVGNHWFDVALGYTAYNNATSEYASTLGADEEIIDAYLGYYEANYGYRFLDTKRLDVYGIIGSGVNTKSANRTYTASFSSGITKYKAINVNLGINMKYYATKRIFLNTSVLYKISSHSTVEISSASIGDYSISSLNGNWLSINLGLGVKLGKTESL
ncbi:MAG TPA: hypothetical protein VJ937_10745 [Salinivirga sp.]|uniref:hypothetical protein n=1 Tax=Salinivirga sp. TaxID=1970192 RepID=UPI002B47174F|nr:hypothetical protein [Salinivirga sp.]HKK59947.1 hypothetical protein [Salinivirga sp.]